MLCWCHFASAVTMEFNGRKISRISHIRDNGSVSLLSPKHKRAEGTRERILFYILFSLPCQSEVTLTNHGCLWAHSHRDGRIILLFCVQELTAKPDLRIYLREFSFTWLDSVTSDWQRRERDATPPSLTAQAILLSFLISGW